MWNSWVWLGTAAQSHGAQKDPPPSSPGRASQSLPEPPRASQTIDNQCEILWRHLQNCRPSKSKFRYYAAYENLGPPVRRNNCSNTICTSWGEGVPDPPPRTPPPNLPSSCGRCLLGRGGARHTILNEPQFMEFLGVAGDQKEPQPGLATDA